MGKSSQRGLITAQQLARLGMGRFFSRGLGLSPSPLPDVKVTKSSLGHGKGIEDGTVGALAWEIAETAQSCAYLAIELQVLASRSYDQEPTLPESTYRLLLDLARIFHGLLRNMHKRLLEVNSREEGTSICVISEDLAEAILSIWGADNLITTVECMTRPASQETPDTSDAGGTR